MESKLSGNITMIQYASKFAELLRFIPKLMASERIKMRRFEEVLAFHVWNQLVGQLIQTYQELDEWAIKIEQVKSELRALKPWKAEKEVEWLWDTKWL